MSNDTQQILPKVLYYECHVTVEPVVGKRLEILRRLAEEYGFRVANLVMLEKDEPNQKDAFCSAKHLSSFGLLEINMYDFLSRLTQNNFKVYRYKLEATLFDSKKTAVVAD